MNLDEFLTITPFLFESISSSSIEYLLSVLKPKQEEEKKASDILNEYSKQISESKETIEKALVEMADQGRHIKELQSTIEVNSPLYARIGGQNNEPLTQSIDFTSDIDELCKKLNDSSKTIEKAITDTEGHLTHFDKLIKDTEETQKSISMANQQLEVIRSELEKTLETRENEYSAVVRPLIRTSGTARP